MANAAARRGVRAAAFAACTIPLALLGLDALRGGLGANPIEAILNRLGYWTLVFLLLTLALTPLRRLSGWTWPPRFQRMIGLFAFFYASLHLAAYVGVDQFFDVGAIVQDVVKRKFITIGMLSFLLLVPLAATSTDRWVRRLGYVRWKHLHRLVYVAAIGGVVHFVWRVKADLREPLIFAGVLAFLLAVRLLGRRPPVLPRRSEGRAPSVPSPSRSDPGDADPPRARPRAASPRSDGCDEGYGRNRPVVA
jgi:sulfoxide reductase heme-binding subunit YedZ